MTVTVFTSNQPRHIYLVNQLASVADKVYAVIEGTTVFPGVVKDRYDNGDIMETYFSKVRDSEKKYFGKISFLEDNVRALNLRMGDLNKVSFSDLSLALDSDYYFVLGSSFIKGDLIDFLIKKNGINIHMGVSPYFRGSACNFWAIYDGHPEMVGATIHLLDKTLDTGNILYHALPKEQEIDPFDLGMLSVKVAIDSLVENIKFETLFDYIPVGQEKDKEIRYSVGKDFTEEIACKYLDNLPNEIYINECLAKRDLKGFINPYVEE